MAFTSDESAGWGHVSRVGSVDKDDDHIGVTRMSEAPPWFWGRRTQYSKVRVDSVQSLEGDTGQS
jgi:hypothetical protein